jgi:hypothetical protein
MINPEKHIGESYGRLKVVGVHSVKNNRRRYKCLCSCGRTLITRMDALKSGRTKSCGCLKKEVSIQNGKKRKTHGMTNARIHRIWLGIKSRCNNGNDTAYIHYGGRGIEVCEEWETDFESFFKWSLANGYEETLTLDRIDPRGDYEPKNCRWASQKQQANNRTNNNNITLNGVTRTVAEWEDISGVNRTTIINRVKRGWHAERVLKKVSK